MPVLVPSSLFISNLSPHKVCLLPDISVAFMFIDVCLQKIYSVLCVCRAGNVFVGQLYKLLYSIFLSAACIFQVIRCLEDLSMSVHMAPSHSFLSLIMVPSR